MIAVIAVIAVIALIAVMCKHAHHSRLHGCVTIRSVAMKNTFNLILCFNIRRNNGK